MVDEDTKPEQGKPCPYFLNFMTIYRFSFFYRKYRAHSAQNAREFIEELLLRALVFMAIRRG
jgi:hypothetical protein